MMQHDETSRAMLLGCKALARFGNYEGCNSIGGAHVPIVFTIVISFIYKGRGGGEMLKAV